MNQKEVYLYFLDEPESVPRVHISIKQNGLIEAHSLEIGKKENLGNEFVVWFCDNISTLIKEFSFVFHFCTERYFSLYTTLYSMGAKVSLM